QWLEAANGVQTRLLGGATPAEVFPDLVASARTLARADLALIALPSADGGLRVAAADGEGAATVSGRAIPADSLAAGVMRDGMPALVSNAADDPRIWPGLLQAAGVGPALYVPLGIAGEALGTLVVARVGDQPAFSEETLRLVESFAVQ